MQKTWRYFLTSALLLICSTGCQPHPAQLAPQPALPQIPTGWSAVGSDSGSPVAWLDSFDDAQLHRLVAEGLNNNFSLQAAAARIKIARARSGIVGADRQPSATADLSADRRQSHNAGAKTISNSFALLGNISWEVDLWNRLALSEQAAISELNATVADLQAARLSLAAEIARRWYRLGEAGQQLQLAQQTEASYRQSLQVIEEQYRNGLAGALDLRLARSSLATARSTRAERQQQFDLQQRQLEILLGRYPSGSLTGPSELPRLEQPVPAGLPSALLERRPDLQAEALRVRGKAQSSAAAARNRLPQFQLTTAAGTASSELYRLFDWNYLVWNLAGSLSQSLFDGGRRSAEQGLAAAELDQQLAGYAELALNAFREVETTLSAELYLRDQETALRNSATEASEALALAEERYHQGLEGIITLLDTQRRTYASRTALLQTKRLRLENRIDLYLALGGSFSAPEPSSAEKDQP